MIEFMYKEEGFATTRPLCFFPLPNSHKELRCDGLPGPAQLAHLFLFFPSLSFPSPEKGKPNCRSAIVAYHCTVNIKILGEYYVTEGEHWMCACVTKGEHIACAYLFTPVNTSSIYSWQE